jgi:hypothetical protein
MAAKPKFNKRNTVKKRGGRPSPFKVEYCEIARQLCLLGSTDVQMAESFGISTVTYYAWLKRYPKFLKATREGKEIADAKVVNSLYQRAIGYSHPDVHVSNFQGMITLTRLTKHYPPDTPAATFWLKNRKSDVWRDRQDIEHSGKISLGELLDSAELS